MARTTLDIDDPVLRELKELQRAEKRPLGKLVSELLAWAMAERNKAPVEKPAFEWHSQRMGPPKVDLLDKDAVWAALDSPDEDGT